MGAELPPKDHEFELEVIENGVSLKKLPLNSQSHFIFGRDQQSVDIFTAHPSTSRIHAVLQHRKKGEWLLFDFGSTHKTKLNHKAILPHKYYLLKIGANIIQFGTSQRMYILNGPKQFEQQMDERLDIKNNESMQHHNKNKNKIAEMMKELSQRAKDEQPTNSKQHRLTNT